MNKNNEDMTPDIQYILFSPRDICLNFWKGAKMSVEMQANLGRNF